MHLKLLSRIKHVCGPPQLGVFLTFSPRHVPPDTPVSSTDNGNEYPAIAHERQQQQQQQQTQGQRYPHNAVVGQPYHVEPAQFGSVELQHVGPHQQPAQHQGAPGVQYVPQVVVAQPARAQAVQVYAGERPLPVHVKRQHLFYRDAAGEPRQLPPGSVAAPSGAPVMQYYQKDFGRELFTTDDTGKCCLAFWCPCIVVAENARLRDGEGDVGAGLIHLAAIGVRAAGVPCLDVCHNVHENQKTRNKLGVKPNKAADCIHFMCCPCFALTRANLELRDTLYLQNANAAPPAQAMHAHN